MDLQLQENVVLITGGSSGLGLALAEKLVQEHARVALMARDSERLTRTAEALREQGGEVLEIAGDVRRVEDLARLLRAATDRWGRIDGVVNNAGALAAGPFAEHDDTVWEQDLTLKLMAAVRLIRLALPTLRESRGAIVNTLSISGKVPDALTMPTSVSRAAGIALTKALSRELAPDGIRVNAVLIGAIESGQMQARAAAAGITQHAYHERMVADYAIPLGRVGRAPEFADLASFLLSPRASYITGSAINLDGGACPVV